MQKCFCLKMRKAFRGSTKGYLRGAKLDLRGEVCWEAAQKSRALPYEAQGLMPSIDEGGRERGRGGGRGRGRRKEDYREVGGSFS